MSSETQIPQQVRVSLTGIKPSQFSIMWHSNDTNPNSPSIIKWGYSKTNLQFQQFGKKKKVNACKNYSTVVHEVVIDTLMNQRIFYSLSNSFNGLWTNIFDFQSQKRDSFTFVAYGDTDTRTSMGKQIIENLKKMKNQNDMILHVGDFAYDTENSQHRWDDWGNSFHNVTNSVFDLNEF
jgi:phosphodiesterase/alkaline phosphatase D-like protein